MSKKSRTIRQARAQLRGAAVTKLDQPVDVVTIIPYLLGFVPLASLVVLALHGERRRVGPCLRVDLAPVGHDAEALARYIVDVIAVHGFDPVIVVAFSADDQRAGAVVEPLLGDLARHGVRVTEALRADGRRWWSYLCTDPSCCTPAGHPYDPDSSRVAAEAVAAGLQRVSDRDALRLQFEPASPRTRQEVAAHCDRFHERQQSGSARPPRLADLESLVARNLDDPEAMPVADVAALTVCVQHIGVRDAAWALMTRANAASHFLLWRRVVQLAPDELMAPAAGLTGFAAWLDGRGVEAMHVVERLDAVCPGYSMGELLRGILDATVNPDSWNGFTCQRDPAC